MPNEPNPDSTLKPDHDRPTGRDTIPDRPHCGQGHARSKHSDHSARLAALIKRAVALPFGAGSLALGYLLGGATNIELSEEMMCLLERTITNAESNRHHG